MEEMKRMLAHHEKGVEKRITEHLYEQTIKHDEDLKALKQLQAVRNNLLTTQKTLPGYQLQGSRTLQEHN
jgi:hypothetical protein